MFSRIYKQFGTAGLILSVVAIVLALGGGAYAANHATASKAGKQGKQGKTGKTGPAGPAGPAGATGPAGPAGPAGAAGTGKEGPEGKQGIQGIQGKQGIPGETGFTKTLPEGETETGAWSFLSATPELEQKTQVPIAVSFPIPLETALDNSHVFFLNKEGKTSNGQEHAAECPGTVEEPKAKEGYFCAYTGQEEELIPLSVTVANGGAPNVGTSKSGALLKALEQKETTNRHEGWGTWAVTAPAAP